MATFHHAGPISNPSDSRRRGIGRAALRAVTQLWQPSQNHESFTRTICEPLEARQLLSASVGPVIVDGNLTFHGTNKNDRIDVARNTADSLRFTLNDQTFEVKDADFSSLTILGKGGADYITVFDTAEFQVGDVTIYGGEGNDNIISGAGNDFLYGGGGADLIQGGGGNDFIDGQGGGDRMIGGRGADTLIGGPGKNVYNAGNDIGDTDDAGSNRRNIQSALAERPVTTDEAEPLAVFGTRTGLTPDQIRTQYAFGNLADQSFTNRGAGQAVAVVIPYDVKQIYLSVNTFSAEFGLPEVNTNNLAIIDASGISPPDDPDPEGGWETEAALQLEWVHAIAPLAQLYLVLADSDLFTDLFLAVDTAVDTLVSRHGGGVVVMSFGSQTGELNPSLQAFLDQSFTRKATKTITFVAGSGDASSLSYPAVSPFVTGVGGTSLVRDVQGGVTGNEIGWSLGGGGISATYPTPGYQMGTTVSGVQVARRASPDLAFNADPISGLALFVANGFGDVDGDNVPDSGWLPGGAGGTSAATPIAAGLIALANEQRAERQRGFLGKNFNDVIYDLNRVFPDGFFTDIVGGTSGANTAVPGYDLVTGNGTPKASLLIDRLGSAGLRAIVTDDIRWFGEFREAIAKVGALSSAGGGFVNGRGAISGNNQLTLVLTPDYSRTPSPPDTVTIGGNVGGHNIDPAFVGIAVNNFAPVTLFRLEDNTVTGTSTVQVTLILMPTEIPTPTDPTQPPPPPPTGAPAPTPAPVPGFFVAGLDDSEPPFPRGEVRTWSIDLNFFGKIARDSKGRERISGEFINRFSLYNPGGEPVPGLEPIFRGEFEL